MYPYPGLAYPMPYPVNYPTYPGNMPLPVTSWQAPAYYPVPVYEQPVTPFAQTTSPIPYTQASAPFVAPIPEALEAPTVAPTTASTDLNSTPLAFSEVKASHILVKTKQEAERIRTEILSGKKRFEEAAKVSKCPSGKKGGDLGFFAKGDMVPEFDKVAFKLPVGVISEPVKTNFGWHLIRVTERR